MRSGLRLKDIQHRYPASQEDTLHGVQLHVDEGQTLAILGPSGCGKSTLLRVIAGLETYSGDVIHNGILLKGRSHRPQNRNFGMVFQDAALFPHLNIEKNIAYGLSALSKGEKQDRISEYASLLKIKPLLHRYPHQLSGGQQQRVAIARAMARHPRLMLLDEPFSSLDVKLRLELAEEIKGVLSGITTIMVTHDQHEAFRMADIISVMDSGKVIQTGTPTQLYYEPKNAFVAEFVGQGCLLDDQQFIRSDWLEVDDQGDLKVMVKQVSDHGHAYMHHLELPSGQKIHWFNEYPLQVNRSILMRLSEEPIRFD